MGRTVFAEERLHGYLTSLAKPDGYTIGLILGQSSGQKDFVVHLAKTPPPLAKKVVEETLISSASDAQLETTEKLIKSVNEIPESWVADHAKHVTRMLPGGMWVLGVFLIGPDDTLSNSSNVHKLRSVLTAIQKNLSWNNYLYGDNKGERLILSFNSVTEKYVCKSVDLLKDAILRPADWKFQVKSTKWHQLETLVDFDRMFVIEANKEPVTLKRQMQDILRSVSETIDSALVVIEGEVRSGDYSIEMIHKKRKDRKACKGDNKDSNKKSLEVSIYVPCVPCPETSPSDVKITSCNASIRLVGQLVSRTFVHQNADVEEATVAIKQDVIRSLASRLEMHWDSLIEEENGSPEEIVTLHEPPRRVLIALPQSKVTLSDYLFPGEGPQEALISLQELLDLEVQESSVQKEIELQADPTDFYEIETNVIPTENGKDSSGNQQFSIYVTGLSIAFIILIAAMILHPFY